MDNIILTRDSEDEISKLKRLLACEIEIKGLRNLKYFLEIEVTQSIIKGGFKPN